MIHIQGGPIMLTKEELPACPVATTVQLIGSKWKLLIIRNLRSRPWRFNELKKDLDGISQKVLTDSLRSMEEDGIITRTVYPEVPPKNMHCHLSGNPCARSLTRWNNGVTNIKSSFSDLPPVSVDGDRYFIVDFFRAPDGFTLTKA